MAILHRIRGENRPSARSALACWAAVLALAYLNFIFQFQGLLSGPGAVITPLAPMALQSPPLSPLPAAKTVRTVFSRPRQRDAEPMRRPGLPVLSDPGCESLRPTDDTALTPNDGRAPLYAEMTYYNLADEWGFVDPTWSDASILAILQRVVDIWWQEARILLRVCPSEALRKVRIPHNNAAAYASYVELPKRDASARENVRASARAAWFDGGFPAKAAERRRRILKELGPTLTQMLIQDPSLTPDGLLRFVRCWPMCQTPWAVFNTMPVFPTYYYFYMNGGGGKRQSTTLRSAACHTEPRKQLWGEDAVCFRFADKRSLYQPGGVVRSWEKNATRLMSPRRAGRLIAHEIGHNFELVHRPLKPGETCKKYPSYGKGELMGQVRAIGTNQDGCSGRAPDGAADATKMPAHQAEFARGYLKSRFDLKQSAAVAGGQTVGQSTEQFRCQCAAPEAGRATAMLFQRLAVPAQGRVRRVRWAHYGATPAAANNRTQIAVFVARRARAAEQGADAPCGRFEVVAVELVPLTAERAAFERRQPMVHSEADLDLAVERGDVLGLATVLVVGDRAGGEGAPPPLELAHRVFRSDGVLVGDIMAAHFSNPATEADAEISAVGVLGSATSAEAARAVHKAVFQGDVSVKWVKTLRGWWKVPEQRAFTTQVHPIMQADPTISLNPVCIVTGDLKEGAVMESTALSTPCAEAMFNYDLVTI